MSRKVAIVVQRCHESIVGGSEALAWQYATLLKEAYRVEVLTTTALDYSDWSNALPEGTERREGVSVRRFRVTGGRSRYWGRLYERLLSDYRSHVAPGRRVPGEIRHIPWATPLQEEFIRHQGPYSEPLLKFLRGRWPDYHSIIFITYLYPTAYFGLLAVPPGVGLFVPTLHDEPPAYLAAYRRAAHRARALLWLTDAERRLGHQQWGELPGRLVSMAVDTRLRAPSREGAPYLLYCGRIDPNKGCPQMFDYFIRFKEEQPSDLRLILLGEDHLPIPQRRDIEYRGFASAEDKFRLMAGARIFMMPSANESFSIVTLEAMAQGTPVLCSGACEVLVDHITRSGAGRVYRDYESFAASLRDLLGEDDGRKEAGARGREYALSRYSIERIRASLLCAVECYAAEAASLASAAPEASALY